MGFPACQKLEMAPRVRLKHIGAMIKLGMAAQPPPLQYRKSSSSCDVPVLSAEEIAEGKALRVESDRQHCPQLPPPITIRR